MQRSAFVRWIGTLAVGIAICGFTTAAGAFAPVADDHTLEIPLPFQQEQLVYGSMVALYDHPSIAASIEAHTGGEWRILSWNRQSRSPHYMMGAGAPTSFGMVSPGSAEFAARRVLDQNSTALKLNPGLMRLAAIREGAGKTAVHFQQTFEGLDVIGGRAHVTFTNTGSAFAIGSDYYPIEGLDIAPTLSQSEAATIAVNSVHSKKSFGAARTKDDSQLFVLPFPTAVDHFEPRLIWKVTVATEEPFGAYVTHIDAHSGEILWRYNDVYAYEYSGVVEASVQPKTYCNGETIQRLKYANVWIDGVGSTVTNALGEWSITSTDSVPRTVGTSFEGPYTRVMRWTGGGAVNWMGTTGIPGTPLVLSWTDANVSQDERDVFDGISDVHDFFEILDPGFAATNRGINAYVGVSGTCNAFWDAGYGIRFLVAGGGCANSGEIQDIVAHEMGHEVQWELLGGSMGTYEVSEGNSDILSNFMSDDPRQGRGLYLNTCTLGFRNTDNTLQYPENLSTSQHIAGRIIGGVLWDVRQNLEATLGAEAGELQAARVWHFGRKLEQPMNQPDQCLSMFIADDDNGNLNDGTPNYQAICDGVSAHDLDGDALLCPAIPGVSIAHVPLMTPQPEGDATITAVVTTSASGAAILAESVRLHYRIGDDPEGEVVMTPTGAPNEYEAIIAGVIEPFECKYFISAADDVGNAATSPRLAPTQTHEFDLPTVWDDLEIGTGWTVNLEGTDTAITGIWVLADPVPTCSQPDDDHTPGAGQRCWITGQHVAGQGEGLEDVDNGSTSLYSPMYDLSAASEAIVKYRRWFSNNRTFPGAYVDDWTVQVRNDAGPWIDLERTHEGAGQDQWLSVRASLTPLLGPLGQVQFRFIASDLGDGSLIEAGVDDFELLVPAAPPTDIADDPSVSSQRMSIGSPSPNPARGTTAIQLRLPRAGAVRVTIHDVAGRQVRTVQDELLTAGRHQVDWDGRDDGGNLVSSGIYFFSVDVGGDRTVRRVVRLH